MDLSDLEPVDFHHLDSSQQKPNYFFPSSSGPHLPARIGKKEQQRAQLSVMMLSLFVLCKGWKVSLVF